MQKENKTFKTLYSKEQRVIFMYLVGLEPTAGRL